mmetsp:Transcript_22773/g.49923  ORF Transcript_22773/g.49923 Transcript_22773/m.49923 type:complete len:449 (+) Transcript_22773:1530-2876(+)
MDEVAVQREVQQQVQRKQLPHQPHRDEVVHGQCRRYQREVQPGQLPALQEVDGTEQAADGRQHGVNDAAGLRERLHQAELVHLQARGDGIQHRRGQVVQRLLRREGQLHVDPAKVLGPPLARVGLVEPGVLRRQDLQPQLVRLRAAAAQAHVGGVLQQVLDGNDHEPELVVLPGQPAAVVVPEVEPHKRVDLRHLERALPVVHRVLGVHQRRRALLTALHLHHDEGIGGAGQQRVVHLREVLTVDDLHVQVPDVAPPARALREGQRRRRVVPPVQPHLELAELRHARLRGVGHEALVLEGALRAGDHVVPLVDGLEAEGVGLRFRVRRPQQHLPRGGGVHAVVIIHLDADVARGLVCAEHQNVLLVPLGVARALQDGRLLRLFVVRAVHDHLAVRVHVTGDVGGHQRPARQHCDVKIVVALRLVRIPLVPLEQSQRGGGGGQEVLADA